MRGLARDSQIVISMIADDQALEQVASGPDGIFHDARRGMIFVDMSTVSPAASARVAASAAAKGVEYLRAPVSGSTVVAAAAGLTIFASGPKDAYDKCLDLFKAMGKACFHVGTGEEARFIKLSLNMMVGITAAMTAEALTLSRSGGMDWQQTIDIVANSVVASPLIGYKVQPLKSRNFAPAFTASQMAKDFDLMLEAARALNVPLPVTALVRQFLGAMKATGKGEQDFFAYVTMVEELAGLATPAAKQ
jgi:3-hydroxyisobutyrate dehydrogenase-like beta-hydroxyacid dehydrogenase